MSEYDHHEADELAPAIEARAEEFRAAMPAVLRRVVLENLADMLDDLAPGSDQGEAEESAFVLALAEFRADLVQNPHAFDRAPRAKGGTFAMYPDAHVVEALALIGLAEGAQSVPRRDQSRAELFAEAQVHALLAIARRPAPLNAAGYGPGPGKVW